MRVYICGGVFKDFVDACGDKCFDFVDNSSSYMNFSFVVISHCHLPIKGNCRLDFLDLLSGRCIKATSSGRNCFEEEFFGLKVTRD